jgi:hypothetical protein
MLEGERCGVGLSGGSGLCGRWDYGDYWAVGPVGLRDLRDWSGWWVL